MKKIMKWNVVEELRDEMKSKSGNAIKAIENKKNNREGTGNRT